MTFRNGEEGDLTSVTDTKSEGLLCARYHVVPYSQYAIQRSLENTEKTKQTDTGIALFKTNKKC